jgi:DNA-directed RNA polymerase subunit RPC12/RpoP
MSETRVQSPKSDPRVSCAKCGKQARLVRRIPITAFGLEEEHTFECVDPTCGHQVQIKGRG